MARKLGDEDEKKTVERPPVGSGPDGEGGLDRMADKLAGEGSLADKLAEERKRKEKRLKEIMGGGK